MSTKKDPLKDKPKPVKDPLSLVELGEILVKHYKIKEGKYELLIEFKVGVGAVGSSDEDRIPGAMVGVSRVGLVSTQTDGPLTIDASVVNSE